MKWISFKGKSSLEFGMIVEKTPSVPIPVKSLARINVPGKSSALIIDDGRYDDFEIAVTLNSRGTRASDEIGAWLQGKGDLVLSDEASFKYVACVIKNPSVIRRELPNAESFDSVSVRFLCEPFKYESVPDVYTLRYSPTVIMGEGTVDSEPVIVVYGTGDCTLTVGDKVLTLTGLTGNITIDCARKIAYAGSTSLSHFVAGDWPKMSYEDTSVSWTGSVTSVVITPNWRWL